MKLRSIFLFCVIFVSITTSWGQTWNLSPTMTATLDSKGVLTISTSKNSEAMPDYDYDTDVPWYAVRDNILSVVIRNSITTIGKKAFYWCSKLETVTIPNSVISIGNEAFEECFKLASITIPNSVTSIGFWAFFNCSSLTIIQIPNSVTDIGLNAFDAYGLTAITVDAGNPAYSSDAGVLYNKNKTILITYPRGKSGATFVIPNSVTTIETGAFEDCSSLTSVTIPNSVITIGEAAFWYCSNLTSIAIPNSVTSIELGNNFIYCKNLTAITVESGNIAYSSDNGVLYDKDKKTLISYPAKKGATFVIPNSVTEIGFRAFEGCSDLTSITIPISVSTINYNAFSDCTSLKDVTVNWTKPLPVSVNTIFNAVNTSVATLHVPKGSKSFYQAANVWKSFGSIADDVVPNIAQTWNLTATMTANLDSEGVLTISTSKNSESMPGYEVWFSGYDNMTDTILTTPWSASCWDIRSLVIEDQVASIGNNAFYNCSNMTSINIPKSVTQIGYSAFSHCTNLIDVTVNWMSPLPMIYGNLFFDVNMPSVTLHVPQGTKALYQAAEVWKTFGTIIDDVNPPITVIPEETQSVGSDGKGTITLNLSVPSDATLTGSFEIQFPEGMTLDEDLTILSAEFSNNSNLVITYKENNTWLIEINSNTLRSFTETELTKVMDIAYTVNPELGAGTYELQIQNLDFELDDGTRIIEESRNVEVQVLRNGTGIKSVENNNIRVSGKNLFVRADNACTISIYTASGQLFKQQNVNAGETMIPLPQGIYLVKTGETVTKIIVR